MPFDTAGGPAIDPLTEIGIIPVPRDVLERHKQYVVKLLRKKAGPMAKWRGMGFRKPQLNDMLANARATTRVYGAPGAWSAAPYRVRRLARRVADAIPNATFTLGYYYTDPYLLVEYQDSLGQYHEACLGIWLNRFRLTAIAQQTR